MTSASSANVGRGPIWATAGKTPLLGYCTAAAKTPWGKGASLGGRKFAVGNPSVLPRPWPLMTRPQKRTPAHSIPSKVGAKRTPAATPPSPTGRGQPRFPPRQKPRRPHAAQPGTQSPAHGRNRLACLRSVRWQRAHSAPAADERGPFQFDPLYSGLLFGPTSGLGPSRGHRFATGAILPNRPPSLRRALNPRPVSECTFPPSNEFLGLVWESRSRATPGCGRVRGGA